MINGSTNLDGTGHDLNVVSAAIVAAIVQANVRVNLHGVGAIPARSPPAATVVRRRSRRTISGVRRHVGFAVSLVKIIYSSSVDCGVSRDRRARSPYELFGDSDLSRDTGVAETGSAIGTSSNGNKAEALSCPGGAKMR